MAGLLGIGVAMIAGAGLRIAAAAGTLLMAAKTEFVVVGNGLDDDEVRRTTNRLRELGAHRVVELTGGMFEWEHFGLPTSKAA